MRSVSRIVVLALAMVLWVTGLQVDGVLAQGDAARVIVGVWEGTSMIGQYSATTRLVFSQDGEKLAWKWSYSASEAKGEAEGTVTKIVLPSLELSGSYTFHSDPRVGGSRVTMSLTVQGEQMEGSGLSVKVNTPFSLRVRKKK